MDYQMRMNLAGVAGDKYPLPTRVATCLVWCAVFVLLCLLWTIGIDDGDLWSDMKAIFRDL